MRRVVMLAILIPLVGCSLHLNAQEERIGRIEASKADASLVDSAMRQHQAQLGQLSQRLSTVEGSASNLEGRVEKLEAR